MKIDITLYRKVSDEIEKHQTKYRTYLHTISNRLRNRKIDIRKLYYALKSLRIYDTVRYASIADEALKIIISSQLSEGEPIIIKDVYKRVSKGRTTTEYSEGGFPDMLEGNKKVIHAEAPSIDSTIYALQSIVEYSAHIQYWDKTIEEAIKAGLRYLQLRDINGDGLLEQSKGEDWIPLLRRDGSLLYTNALYLKLLEDLYYLYLDKDKEYSEYIKSLYTKVYRRIEESFWMDSLYIEYINSSGAKVWRAGVDSSTAGRPIIMREANKIHKHFTTLYNRLYNSQNNLLITSEARIKVNPEDRNLYRISTPLQSAVYAMDVAEAGYPNLALKIMDTVFPYEENSLIIIDDKNKIVSRKRDGDIALDLVLLGTYKIISGIVKGGEGASAGF